MDSKTISEHLQRRMGLREIVAGGWQGQSVKVAIVDTGIDTNRLPGAPPIWQVDYSEDGYPGDRRKRHGTGVAACVRAIAPRCEIMNAKVVSHRGRTLSKSAVAQVVADLVDSGADIINISLAYPPGRCDPTPTNVAIESYDVAEVSRTKLDESSSCPLCRACCDAFIRGVIVVAAAGNQGRDELTCPARSPGATAAIATWSKALEKSFWSGRSIFKRWWDWKFTDRLGRHFGTSFAAGYASGEFAVLWPAIQPLGWREARKRMGLDYAPGDRIPSGLEYLSRLTKEAGHIITPLGAIYKPSKIEGNNTGRVIEALSRVRTKQRISEHLTILETLCQVSPSQVLKNRRPLVGEYLDNLTEAIGDLPPDGVAILARALGETRRRWNYPGETDFKADRRRLRGKQRRNIRKNQRRALLDTSRD